MTPGFHIVTAEQYHADDLGTPPSLSSSLAQILLAESPRKAWHSHPRLNKNYREDQDPKFDLGRCAHSVLLENDASKIVVVNAADWRTKDAKEKRAEARAFGKTAMLEHHYDDVRRMVDAALAFIEDSPIADAWHAAKPEVTGLWCEGDTWFRCRYDRILQNQQIIFDYKTTGSAAPEPFGRLLVRMGYHIQEAFYRRGARALRVADPKFIFLAQSDEAPHECSLLRCDPALQEIADAQVERAIGMWRDCLETNDWPSYGDEINIVVPPAYMMAEHEERLLAVAGIGYREPVTS